MAYKQNDLGLLIKLDSDAATEKIIETAVRCDADVGKMAIDLNAHRRSVHRWIVELGLHERLADIRQQAKNLKKEERLSVGVDMSSGEDSSVMVTAKRKSDGSTEILSVKELPRRRRGVSLA